MEVWLELIIGPVLLLEGWRCFSRTSVSEYRLYRVQSTEYRVVSIVCFLTDLFIDIISAAELRANSTGNKYP